LRILSKIINDLVCFYFIPSSYGILKFKIIIVLTYSDILFYQFWSDGRSLGTYQAQFLKLIIDFAQIRPQKLYKHVNCFEIDRIVMLFQIVDDPPTDLVLI